MKNNKMGYDPRGIANAILDFADRIGEPVSNLRLNKLLYFFHRDYMLERGQKLSKLTFEAWEYGPVLPLIYHQFKEHRAAPITTRAMKIDSATGARSVVEYLELGEDLNFIQELFQKYIKYSPMALMHMSHEESGPWHQVWHGTVENVGMKITDDLILQYSSSANFWSTDSHAQRH